MEFLIENENELRTLAEKGDYWDVLHLADFLNDKKRYEEAKEWYLKIAGSDDLSGDANSHFFQMLLDMGEYAESLEYFGYIQSCCDTSPREGAYMRMMQELCNPESKLFMYFDEESFYYDCLGLIYSNYASFYMYSQLVDGEDGDDCGDVKTGELYLKKNMETILLTRAKSEDEEIKKSAKLDLLWLYLKGSFRFGDFSWKCAKRKGKNIKKAIKTSKVFAEHPDIIDEIYGDFSYFYTAIEDICENYKDNAIEYARRFVVATLKYAEELGNVEDVLSKIESELYIEQYGFLLNLGYIPKGISRVPAISFSGKLDLINEELESIVIPNTITTISDDAFWNCTSLISVVIPESVTSIGDGAFFGCSSLTDIVIPAGIKSIGNVVFFGCESLTSVVIPDGVASIGEQAFGDCYSLKNIVIPASVISIADNAFDCMDWDDEYEEYIPTIKGYAGSYAEAYAKKHGILFEEI